MGEILNIISAEELFGAESVLLSQNGGVAMPGIESLGSLYQLAVGVLAIFFTAIFVNFFELFRHLVISSISGKAKRLDMHIYSSDIKNIEIVTSIVGTILLALLVMRLSVMEGVSSLFAPLGHLSYWGLGASAFLAIVAMMAGERAMLYVVGLVSGRQGACNDIWHIKLLHFSLVIILLSPFLLFALLTDGTSATVALYISVAICSVLFIFFLKETFSLFRAQRFSIFHWILYLCALELLPLSLLLAPIVRG
ncbi:MAG: DUF4271 domain-containing protein [Alistipes sp.]|nr:DUF4271 domain-containing protein [Alistipes sp.]